MSSSITKAHAAGSIPEWLEIVRSKVEGLSFGVVQIVVHDRKVTQIERTEKTRLDSRLRKRRAVAKTTNFPPTGATGGHRT